jgi:hypothetical protein
VCALGLGLGGCGIPQARLRAQLEDPRPLERVRAVAQAAESGRKDLIPALVDRLDDADVAVRMYAILALEKLTGTRLGYDYAADIGTRRQAVLRWREAVATGLYHAPDSLAQAEPPSAPEAEAGAEPPPEPAGSN